MKTTTLFSAVALFLSLTPASLAMAKTSSQGFVQVHGTHFEVNGAPYHFIGTNFWYGMNLGADDATGDRKRLGRELDRLRALGVTNLRVLGASEGPDSEPWRIVPALQPKPGVINKHVMRGLDYLLSEMGKRGMRAVVCLNNFWPWSGGMAQYRAWASTGAASAIPYPPPAVGGDWGVFQNYSSGFYANAHATALANAIIADIVKHHAGDTSVMAWELGNEPRGGIDPATFNTWIDRTAGLIKKLDHNHLVTVGSEGDTPTPDNAGNDFAFNHSSPNIDYATIHIWAQNWDWYDPKKPETLETSISKMKDYFNGQVEKARALAKPLVIEEFGLARNDGSYDPTAATTARDRYYREVFEIATASAAAGSPVAGVNFWAWAGEARPRVPGGFWKAGDPFIGDPPHESQGWYSVYDNDASTLKIIADFASRMSRL